MSTPRAVSGQKPQINSTSNLADETKVHSSFQESGLLEQEFGVEDAFPQVNPIVGDQLAYSV